MTDLQLLKEFAKYVRGIKPPEPGVRRYINCFVHNTRYEREDAKGTGPVWYQNGFWGPGPFGQFTPPSLGSIADVLWPMCQDGRMPIRHRQIDVYISLTEQVAVTLDFHWPGYEPSQLFPSDVSVTFAAIVRGHPEHITLIGWDERSGGTHVVELVVNEYFP
jgi:hypothetical protein